VVSLFTLSCPRVTLTVLSPDQAELVRDYYVENRAHLETWEPLKNANFYDLEAIRKRLYAAATEFREGRSFPFAVIENSTGKMIGVCNFSNIIRGVFQACYLGFAISASHQGKGIMHEAVEAGITYMFETVGLHRIMANHLPHNERSARLLARLGFEREGYAKSYLKIAGQWQDHVLTSLINPKER
jgi:[ribosomal protein S5]-alanine N-acetyltransferase